MYRDQNNNNLENQLNHSQEDSNIIDVVPEKKGTGKKVAKFIGGAFVFGAVAGFSFSGYQLFSNNFLGQKNSQSTVASTQEPAETKDTEEKTTLTSTSTTGTSSGGSDVSSVVENAEPAIVAINCTITETSSMGGFFGQEYKQEVEGSGSGIIIGENSKELLIVTNNHVISGDGAKVEVVFVDNTTAQATVKGIDSDSDLAVISIQLSDLSSDTKNKIKIATLGDSDNIKVGEIAIAIGNALGYGQSVTVGYISAKDREVALEDNTMTLLQTDAAINPGNSGGALLNASGEVIGINSVKYASEEVEGMGYAIPISTAIPIINDLMNREQLAEDEQAYLGIVGRDITQAYAEGFNMPEGIYVGRVSEGSPAEKAGVVSGDIITSFNGREVSTMEGLQEILLYTKAGEKVEIVIKRLNAGEYQEKTVTVTLGNKEDSSNSSTENSNNGNSQNQQNNQQQPQQRRQENQMMQ